MNNNKSEGLINALLNAITGPPKTPSPPQIIQLPQVAEQKKQQTQQVQPVQQVGQKQQTQQKQQIGQKQQVQQTQQKRQKQQVQQTQQTQQKQQIGQKQQVQQTQQKQQIGQKQQVQQTQQTQQKQQIGQKQQVQQIGQMQQVQQVGQMQQKKQVQQPQQVGQMQQPQQVGQIQQQTQEVQVAQPVQTQQVVQKQQKQQRLQSTETSKAPQSPIQAGGNNVNVGYIWQRQNSFGNFKSEGIVKRDEWLNEVRSIYKNGSTSWKAALAQASSNRKLKKNTYKTVKSRVIESYKGRNAENIKCAGPVCPGKYNKTPSTDYRPNKHPSKRVLTEKAALELLKNYYKQRGTLTSEANEKSMRKDISTKRAKVLKPCATKTIVDKNGKSRNIAIKSPDCADSWLYRKSKNYDMYAVDNGNKGNKLYTEGFNY